jgi:hypothetical protein
MRKNYCEKTFVGLMVLLCLLAYCGSAGGEKLYNGIVLPDEWPPKPEELTLDPVQIPYLQCPPEVISIDVGRQLFVDKFLVEETTLQQSFHTVEYYSGNPILKPDKPWEMAGREGKPGPCAMPFSDGVWYDPQAKLFKMWYMGGYVYNTCYATSVDGIHWEKPSLDIKPGTNIIFDGADSFQWQGQELPSLAADTTVWLDLAEQDPQKRYKMSRFTPNARTGQISIFYSADGIAWQPVARCGHSGDRSTMFYNPFRKVWVYSLRDYWEPPIEGMLRKFRRYREGSDLISAITSSPWDGRTDVDLWFCLDRYDLMKPELTDSGEYAMVYNLDAVAYESVMLGLFANWQGQNYDDGRPKRNELFAGFSRDGWHWHRPYRRPLIPESQHKGDWNWGNIQSAGGCCLVVGDKLYFYVSGRFGKQVGVDNAESCCSTGLAMLRRDGFASMRGFKDQGSLTTRPLQFGGKYMFVNVDAKEKESELLVEILDKYSKVIAPFSKDNCVAFQGDSTITQVKWKDRDNLSELAGKVVRFRFYLKQGDLYSFWVSPDKSGASYGYVAAGGPGFTTLTDTVGAAGY